ncbi:hypothetical protein AGMMS50255_4620 [Spirochaetia bacterium]|nr:hypothetical protein AGMMS50255_4620 [Spirochaetia bacterium]
MKKTGSFAAIFGMALMFGMFFCGCATSSTFFTKVIRDSLDDEQIHKVQYYIDEKILLSRELEPGKSPEVSSGTVVFRNGRNVEEILISKKTPGQLMETVKLKFEDEVEIECLGICFESSAKDADKILYFRPGPDHYRDANVYYLVYYGGINGVIQYGDEFYTVSVLRSFLNRSNAAWPYLLGDVVSTKYKENAQRRTVDGRVVK